MVSSRATFASKLTAGPTADLAYRAPYFSGAILICMGSYVAFAGRLHLR
jgi:hypothetical protein